MATEPADPQDPRHPIATIWRIVQFEAAHRLPHVAPGHKCGRLHGHSYTCEVYVRGRINDAGWVMDFADIQVAVEPLRAQLDHHYLNEVEGLENPTSENLARWIWARLQASLPGLCAVVIRETCTSGCRYEGPLSDGPSAA